MTIEKNNSPMTAPMWWDGGDRAITAREKATIEEHGPSCYTIPLVPVQAVDPEDPWRGLYLPARMPAPSEYGDLFHPDIPSWPDDREDALDKLVHAQGFDFHIVAGDFTEAAMEDGDELYWQELRAWNPEAPEGEWRLAWKGDTEDGPYAWFVRPMALRPEPAALAARQPEAQEPVAWRYHAEGDATKWYYSDTASLLGLYQPLYAAPPAQGIDPGPVREFLRRRMAQWRSHLPSDPGAPGTVAISGDGEGGYNNDVRMYREGIALMDRVLALIDDQRDAAPGVANA